MEEKGEKKGFTIRDRRVSVQPECAEEKADTREEKRCREKMLLKPAAGKLIFLLLYFL